MGYGRRKIFTDATEITAANVADEVRKAVLVHSANRNDTNTLYDYYRGKTKILGKAKEVRESINHKINENRAYEIVGFHRGYVFGEPIQYIRRENAASKVSDDEIAADINALNGYMSDADKAAVDNELAEWLYVCGTSYRLTLPNKKWSEGSDESPVNLYALDPRRTFVVYSNSVDQRPMMGVQYVEGETGERTFGVYTENAYYSFKEFGEPKEEAHALGMIPIIEYPADNPRLGVFEIAMPLLDALDELQSNRLDDVVQFVNSFLAILGGQLDEETYQRLNEWKTLCLPEGVDAKYLSTPMSQSDVQTLKDDLYQSILTICGVPNRNGGSSTSDTGSAVIMRDGWAAAEAKAKATELVFKRAEKRFLKLVLRILRDTAGTKLRLTDVEPQFTRRNYENIASKSQVLIAMLNNPWIHPEVAYSACGMFPDPESAYLQGRAWKEEQEAKAIANFGAGAMPRMQQETDGSAGAGAGEMSEV
jgi:SPP1 family phage portal protein